MNGEVASHQRRVVDAQASGFPSGARSNLHCLKFEVCSRASPTCMAQAPPPFLRPVDVELIQSVSDWRIRLTSQELSEIEALPEEFILGTSRFVPYKRLDWVIRACAEVDIPVVIAGGGPEEAHLRAMAEEVNVLVRFVIDPSTPLLYALYQSARLFVFPAIEDFGIMPVEAHAAGTAVVTTRIGGATESHIDGISGVTASSDEPNAIGRAVAAAMDLSSSINSMSMVERFGRSRFCRKIQEWMVRAK